MIRSLVLFFCLSLLGCSVKYYSGDVAAKGTFKKHLAFESRYVAPRNIEVWLPPGYERNPKQQYDLLLMHDGQMLFDSTTTWNHQEWCADETAEKLIKSRQVKPFIIVGVWNTPKRFAEYVPQKPMNAVPDSLIQSQRNFSRTDIQSDNYLRFLTTELLPFLEKEYRIKAGKEHRFIAGSSMGGLISMYAICEYPEVFGGAICMSTHWPIAFNNNYPIFPTALIDYFAAHLPNPKTHMIYFDYGTATLDSLYQPHQMRMNEKMKNGGYTHKNWLTKEFPNADHSERAWRERLEIPLKFILQP